MTRADRHRLLPVAIALEAGLGLLGCALMQWRDIPLAARLDAQGGYLWRGIVAAIPLLLGLALILKSRWKPLADLRRVVSETLGESLLHAPPGALFALAAAAGIGEELLFRGALQPWAQQGLGPVAGWIGVSLLFGLLHAATVAYFVLATLVGAYFGWLADAYDNLTVPIIAHAFYDWVALVVLRRHVGRE
jgi:uncharacterized protein